MVFYNKGFNYINLSSIFCLDNVKNLFLDKFKINESLSVIYSLGKTKRNKTLNYKKHIFSIDTNDNKTYGTGRIKCDRRQYKDFVDENYDHVLTSDLE